MNIISTDLDGVFEIENKVLKDFRGAFIKTFHADVFSENGLETEFKESYYSTSKKDVLRGMHLQLPPHDHTKLVYVTDGEILDVVVDVRQASPTVGKCFSTRLTSMNAKSLYIPKGFAHGFLTLSDSATVVYQVSTVYAPESDTGVRWDSINFDWGLNNPTVSDRDMKLDSLSKFFSRL